MVCRQDLLSTEIELEEGDIQRMSPADYDGGTRLKHKGQADIDVGAATEQLPKAKDQF